MFAKVVGSLLSGLVLVGSPLAAQQVSAQVYVGSGPVAGRVLVRDGYSTYHRPPARRVVVADRYAPRVIVVERVHRHRGEGYWRRLGYRPITVYYADGRFYDRPLRHRHGVREVVVYERGGRFYAACDDHGRYPDHDRHHHDNWD